MISRGYTYAETAGHLSISVHTVQAHIKNIYGKLAVNSRTEAVFEAHKLGSAENLVRTAARSASGRHPARRQMDRLRSPCCWPPARRAWRRKPCADRTARAGAGTGAGGSDCPPDRRRSWRCNGAVPAAVEAAALLGPRIPRQETARLTYRLAFQYVPTGHDTPAFYLARAANSFEMRLNGKLLAASGDLSAPAIHAGQRPLYVPVPEVMLRADNELVVTIAALSNGRGGLSRIEFGPGNVVRSHYDGALWFRVIGPLVIAAVSLLLAAISLLIWWRQRDPLFGLYALAEIAWAISLAEFFLADTPPLPRGVWQVVVLSSRAIFMVATAKFAFIIIDVRARWPGWAVNAYLWIKLPLIVLMASVLSLPYLKVADWGINVAIACCVAGALVWSALRRPNHERVVLAVALGACHRAHRRRLRAHLASPATSTGIRHSPNMSRCCSA
ncbi:response regulator transcription factor [Cupriavidus basilensis]